MTDDELAIVAARLMEWPPDCRAELAELPPRERRVVAWLVLYADARPVPELEVGDPDDSDPRSWRAWAPAPPSDGWRELGERLKAGR